MKEKYFVYIIQSLKSGKIYTGFSCNLENRIQQHNDELNNGYTHGRGPWELLLLGKDCLSKE